MPKDEIKHQSVPTRIIQKAVSQAREFNSVFDGAAVVKCHQLGGWEIVNLSLKSLLEKIRLKCD